MKNWGHVLQEVVYALSQYPVYGALSQIAKIDRYRNERGEMGVALFTITPSHPLTNCLLPIPLTLYSVGLEVIVPKEEMLPPGNTTMILLN